MFTSHDMIQQMITQSLMGKPPAVSSQQQQQQQQLSNYQQSIITTNASLLSLRQNLLNAKVPYDIVGSIPIVTAQITDNHSVLSPEWNRYLAE